MNDLYKRFLFFLGLCIPSRFLISYILANVSQTHLKYIGLLLLLPVIGWSYIFLSKSRKTGAETLGAPIWWNYMRPLHAALYFIAALYALDGKSKAYLPIALDTIIGLFAFLHYHKLLF